MFRGTSMLRGARKILYLVVFVWELAQVELNGRISADHMNKLRPFMDQASLTKSIIVCLALPLPCVIVMVVLESVPLAPPDAGTLENYAFWFRYVATLAVLTPGGLSIFQSFLPELNITRTAVMVLSILGGITSGGTAFAASFLIGFPVPFTLLVSIPGWFAAIVPPTVAIYVTRLRHDRALFRRFICCWLMLMWLALSVIIYPIYVFGFHRLGSLWQVLYISIFPLVKILGRNVISWLVGDHFDVKAGIVIFNIEVCSSLYMSVALENSATLSTTLTAVAIDIVQSMVAISDVSKMMRGVNRIILSSGPRTATSSFRTLLLNSHGSIPIVNASSRPSISSSSAAHEPEIKYSSLRMARVHPTTTGGSTRTWEQNSESDNGVVDILPHIEKVHGQALTSSVEAQSRLSNKDLFLARSARVLYTAEFVLLVKYVEAIVPAIYSAFAVIAYNLGHWQYYNQFESMTSENMHNIVLNVMLYCLLKILSFCILCVALSHKMGLSAIHLVAFVLIHQWEVVFSRILLWAAYTTLTSLKHSGPDFTFRFAWLHRNPST